MAKIIKNPVLEFHGIFCATKLMKIISHFRIQIYTLICIAGNFECVKTFLSNFFKFPKVFLYFACRHSLVQRAMYGRNLICHWDHVAGLFCVVCVDRKIWSYFLIDRTQVWLVCSETLQLERYTAIFSKNLFLTT